MKRIGTITLLAAALLAGPLLAQQQQATGSSNAAKSEPKQHGCKEMEKHHKHEGTDKSTHSEKHADCQPDSMRKGQMKGHGGHGGHGGQGGQGPSKEPPHKHS